MKVWLPLLAALASSPALADDAPAPASAPAPAPAPAPTPAPAPVMTAPGATPPASNGPDFAVAVPPKDIVITSEGERTPKNIALIAGIAAGSAVLIGVGVYYNLDSQSAANAVTANAGDSRVWSPADKANYDRAHDSAIKAGVLYGFGGAALIAAIVTLVATEPKSDQTIIHPHVTPTVAPTVAPVPGGATFGGVWSF